MAYQAPKGGFRTFLIIWLSQSVSVFGSALTYFAVNIWLVESAYPRPEQGGQLAWALATLGIAWSLPYIAFTPLAGAFADRHDRKRIMLAMDVTNGILSALTAGLMAAGLLNIWLLVILISLSGLAGSVHGSAFDASYAMLVTDEQLPRANGMMQTMGALSSLLSPAAAAALITLPAIARRGALGGGLGSLLGPIKEGAALAIGVDAATFLLAAAVLAPLFVP
jgi:MFS family permease